MTLGHKPVRILQSLSPLCSLALVTDSSHSPLRVFSNLRTLSFSVSRLSRVLPAGCALFANKPGVHPLPLPFSPPFRGTLFSQVTTLPGRLPFIGRWPLAIVPFSALSLSRENWRRIAVASPLTPFPTSLTRKQGGRGPWSYHHSSPLARQSSPRSGLCVLCVSAVSPLFFPFVPFAYSPCPSQHFPLEWGYPFPVITGEN